MARAWRAFLILLFLAGIYLVATAASYASQYPTVTHHARAFEALRPLGGKYVDRVRANLDRFFELYQASFDHERCTTELLADMYACKRRVGKNVMDLVYRMPNDLVKYKNAREALENIQYLLTVHIEDARTRGKLPLLVREPLGEYNHLRFARAANHG